MQFDCSVWNTPERAHDDATHFYHCDYAELPVNGPETVPFECSLWGAEPETAEIPFVWTKWDADSRGASVQRVRDLRYDQMLQAMYTYGDVVHNAGYAVNIPYFVAKP